MSIFNWTEETAKLVCCAAACGGDGERRGGGWPRAFIWKRRVRKIQVAESGLARSDGRGGKEKFKFAYQPAAGCTGSRIIKKKISARPYDNKNPVEALLLHATPAVFLQKP